jgi:hypothetical protein
MEKGINPKEPFLYRVLEYIGLGPHSDFFIGSSTSYGSTANYLTTNYIMTTGEEIHLDTPDEAEFYKTFLDPKNMDHAVEITFASLIRVLLSLSDVFGENLRNYGITTDRFLFVDQLPGVNGPFDFYDQQILDSYSPRTHLKQSFGKNKGLSNLFDLKSIYEKEGENFDKELNRRVNDRLFKGNQEKGFLPLESAIKKANEDVIKLINDNGIYFINGAIGRLQQYLVEKLIGKNLTNYKKSNYYKRVLGSIGNL